MTFRIVLGGDRFGPNEGKEFTVKFGGNSFLSVDQGTKEIFLENFLCANQFFFFFSFSFLLQGNGMPMNMRTVRKGKGVYSLAELLTCLAGFIAVSANGYAVKSQATEQAKVQTGDLVHVSKVVFLPDDRR